MLRWAFVVLGSAASAMVAAAPPPQTHRDQAPDRPLDAPGGENFLGTIRRGVALGASAIELWQDYGGFPEVEEAKLRHWAQLIKKNAKN